MAEVPIDQLPLPQLNAIKQQLDEEVQQLGAAYQQLKMAQQKYADCMDALQQDRKDGTSILVPFTNSLYVPGLTSKSDRVLVDIGTGYYAEKSTAKAKEYYKRRVEYVKQNAEGVQQTLLGKQNMKKVVETVMQGKLAAMQQQQQQQVAA